MNFLSLLAINLEEASEEIGVEFPWKYEFTETAEDNSYAILSLETDHMYDLEDEIKYMEENGTTECFSYRRIVNELKLIKLLREKYNINKDSILCYISY